MKTSEFRKLIREEVRKVMNETSMATPTTYDFDNPGDEWTAILTKAMDRYQKSRNNRKVKKDVEKLLTIVYKLGAKKTGKSLSKAEAQEYVEFLLSAEMIDNSTTVTDLIAYIKNDLDPNELPNWVDSDVRREFKKGKFVKITPTTKLKVGDNIVSMKRMTFAEIVAVNENTYSISFDMDYAGEKPFKKSKKSLESNWLLIKK